MEVLPYPPEFKLKPPATPSVSTSTPSEQKAIENDPDADSKAESQAQSAQKEHVMTHTVHVSIR